MKCSVCKDKVEVTFLNKIRGTYIKKGGKLEVICSKCQRAENEKIKRSKKQNKKQAKQKQD